MSSLTDSFLISDLLNNKKLYKTNPDEPKPNKKWYDRVYLCVEKPAKTGYMLRVNGFDCKLFPSLEAADIYSKKEFEKKNGLNNMPIRMIMFPVCKWMPCIFDKMYLKYQLKNMYWSDDITLYRRIIKNDINR